MNAEISKLILLIFVIYCDEGNNVLYIIYNIFFIFRVDRKIAQKLL